MTLPSGRQLGPYTITSPLGAGGMGEVYRARDSRLGRDVAIKVLPASSSTDGDRLQRFEQEARAAAALNHPNILALYDIGRAEARPYLVTELLGRELFYPAADGTMMVVAVDGTGTAFRAEAPRALFHAPVASLVGYQYTVTNDGERFLVNTALPAPLPVTVISDWTLTLKK